MPGAAAWSSSGRTIDTTRFRSMARSPTTSSASRRRALPAARPARTRSASTPSTKSSSWSRRSTCAWAASREAASMPSREAAPTTFMEAPISSTGTRTLVGDGPLERPLAPFSNKQYGASVGGPIVQEQGVLLRDRRADEAQLSRLASRSPALRARRSATRPRSSA